MVEVAFWDMTSRHLSMEYEAVRKRKWRAKTRNKHQVRKERQGRLALEKRLGLTEKRARQRRHTQDFRQREKAKKEGKLQSWDVGVKPAGGRDEENPADYCFGFFCPGTCYDDGSVEAGDCQHVGVRDGRPLHQDECKTVGSGETNAAVGVGEDTFGESSPVLSWTTPPRTSQKKKHLVADQEGMLPCPMSWDEVTRSLAAIKGRPASTKKPKDRSWLKPCFKEVCKKYALKSKPQTSPHQTIMKKSPSERANPSAAKPQSHHCYTLRPNRSPQSSGYVFSSEPEDDDSGRWETELSLEKTDMYVVEAILDRRIVKDEIMYLTKWEGYKEPTLEPEKNFSPGCLRLFGYVSNLGNTIFGSSDEQASDDESYEVERILDCRIEKGRKMFLTKWVGHEKPTLEPEENFSPGCSDMLEEASKGRISREQ